MAADAVGKLPAAEAVQRMQGVAVALHNEAEKATVRGTPFKLNYA